MIDKFSESLLSAYLDGEATDEERADIEARLKSSNELRRELNELRRVSGLLQSLESKPLPTEFAAEVLQLAERESLIPSTASQHAPRRASRLTARQLWITGLVSTAAIVFVMISTWPTPPYGESDYVARTDSPDAAAQKLAMNDAGLPAAARTKAEDMVSQPAEDSPAHDPVAPSDESATLSVVPKPDVKTEKKDADSGLVFSNKELNEAQVGDIVEALDASEGKIAVVRLTVVDRQAGLESFQLLLQQHKIPAVGKNPVESESNQLSKTSQDQLMAVFVETDSKMLTAALEQLQREVQFQELQLEDPIQLASLGRDASARIRWAGVEPKNPKVTSLAKPEPKEVPIKGTGTKDEEDAKKRDAKKQRVAKSDSKTGAARTKEETFDTSRSRQLQLTLSREILNRLGQRRNLATVRRQVTKADKLEPSAPGGGNKLAVKSRKGGRPVKVLFVLVTQTAGNDTPAPPNKSKAKRPSDGAA